MSPQPSPVSRTVSCLGPRGFHRMRYLEWGAPDNPRVVVCVHGLTRNAHDFDELAQRLSRRYRVLCPDVVGRGGSDWLADKAEYGYPRYLADLATLIARSGAESVDWVGTSMGGLIGMLLAATPSAPIGRLVINDVGPFLPKAALERIASYVGQDPRFDGLNQVEAYLRRVHAPFGPLTDAQWQAMAVHGSRRSDDGRLALGYDPGIAEPFRGGVNDVDLWAVWGLLRCNVLVVRGVESDLLSAETAAQMVARGPAGTQLVEFAGIGHAPAFMSDDQIGAVETFLAD